MSLGLRLKNAREKKGWSQIYVAERIGTTNSVLSNYERDYRDPDTETLRKLADLYEVSSDYLIGRTDIPNISMDPDELPYDPDVQFIARSKKEMTPEAFRKLMELTKQVKDMFKDENGNKT